MNRSDLIDIIAKKHGFNTAFAERVVATFFESIRGEVADGNRVRIRNFGTFEARQSRGETRAKFTGSKNFFNAQP